MNGALFFLKAILYTFFLFLLIYGGLEVGVLGLESWIRFLGVGVFVAWGLGPEEPLWRGALWVFGVWGSLHGYT